MWLRTWFEASMNDAFRHTTSDIPVLSVRPQDIIKLFGKTPVDLLTVTSRARFLCVVLQPNKKGKKKKTRAREKENVTPRTSAAHGLIHIDTHT
jgi:hypothetical protein